MPGNRPIPEGEGVPAGYNRRSFFVAKQELGLFFGRTNFSAASRLLAVLLCVATGGPTAFAATETKVLRLAFRAAETGFDPQKIEDRYSVGICENLFDSLLTYDWLARPVKLVPLLAETVPQGEEGGTRFTFRIKPGIYFAEDAAFKGKRRELVARVVGKPLAVAGV